MPGAEKLARARMVALIGLAVAGAPAGGCAHRASAPVVTSNPAVRPVPVATAPLAAGTPSATPPPTVDMEGGAISNTLTIGSGSSKSTRPGIARPSDPAAVSNGIRVLLADDDISKGANAKVRAMTQDRAGHWWVLLDVSDAGAKGQGVVVFDGKAWQDVVYGEKVTDSDLPPDVHF